MSVETTTVKMGGVTGAQELKAEFVTFGDGTRSVCFSSGAARMFVNTTAEELRALYTAAKAAATDAAIEEAKREGATA